jgi:hypothetical protein
MGGLWVGCSRRGGGGKAVPKGPPPSTGQNQELPEGGSKQTGDLPGGGTSENARESTVRPPSRANSSDPEQNILRKDGSSFRTQPKARLRTCPSAFAQANRWPTTSPILANASPVLSNPPVLYKCAPTRLRALVPALTRRVASRKRARSLGPGPNPPRLCEEWYGSCSHIECCTAD